MAVWKGYKKENNSPININPIWAEMQYECVHVKGHTLDYSYFTVIKYWIDLLFSCMFHSIKTLQVIYKATFSFSQRSCGLLESAAVFNQRWFFLLLNFLFFPFSSLLFYIKMTAATPAHLYKASFENCTFFYVSRLLTSSQNIYFLEVDYSFQKREYFKGLCATIIIFYLLFFLNCTSLLEWFHLLTHLPHLCDCLAYERKSSSDSGFVAP